MNRPSGRRRGSTCTACRDGSCSAGPEELRRRTPDTECLEFDELGTPDELITTVIATGEHLELRERAIRAHPSQTSPFEVMPPDLRCEFLSAESLRRVRPEWTGGPLETEIFAAD